MTLAAIFLVNAALSFALSLVLAALLGPDGFGRYAIGLSLVLVVNTGLFEWLRLSTTRFYSERVRSETPAVRASLDAAYLASGGALAIGAGAALLLPAGIGVPGPLLAATAACGLAYGWCEYRMALARARFLEGTYASIGLLRACLGFLLAAGAAALSGDPAIVLAGTAASAFLPILAVRRRLADPASGRARVDFGLLRDLARYALPLVAASALYQLLPLVNRTLLAGRDGYVEAGYFSLASELATRLFQNLGAALDLVLFQYAVRAEELHGRAAGENQVGTNAGAIAAVVIPAAAGLWSVWPSFEALFIPAAFQGRLAGTADLMIPALAAFALVQYAVNPVFQLRRRTAPVIAAAAIAISVDLAIVLGWPGRLGPEGFAAAQLAATTCGLLALAALAVREGARLPWRQAGTSLALAAVMAAALWPLGRLALPPALLLGLQVLAGVAVYGALALAVDLAGIRRWRPGARRPAPGPVS